ncbi:uncharacterized protein BP5553_07704 [Venustampulla echinocandica]|uniref:Rhodopsin domain-containing protein n=1 Tax=Venustampulla echinocandica TaxID=2656787 RepID=A0A370THA2_9HELO|nr:uncharacterized protein BP5553_07704 [Venustampulla echinocandica]RDL34576.1 hypothetical protein BP5553_07704 [Venustampulla echinocandica]
MPGLEILVRAVDPLLLPPDGEEPNYINPLSRGQKIVIASVVLTSFAFVFVIARVIVKGFVTKRFGWDDIFCVGAMAASIARTVMSVILVDTYGIGVHVWNFNPKNIVAAHNMQFAQDMVCGNAYDTWHFSFEADCLPTTDITVAIGAVNIFTDSIIMVMPIPIIWKLQLKQTQRWGLLAVFGTGLFVLVSAIVREVIVVKTDKELDQSWVVVDEIIWLTVELNIGIICISLPALSPLYTRVLASKFYLSSLRNLLSFSGAGSKSRSKLGSTDGTKESKQDSSPYTDSVYLVNMGSSHAEAQGDARSSGDPHDYMAYETHKNGIQVRHKVEQHVTQAPNDGHDIV